MAVDRNALVAAFPEFGNATAYPDSQIEFWLTQASYALSAARFGRQIDLATILYVAHNIALSVGPKRAEAISPGGAASVSIAPASSKAVDGVSKSYDNSLVAIPNAGPWNATSYGQRFYQLLKGANTGPLYRVHPGAFPRGRRGIGWR
jgi:hypothetical protein